MKSCITVIHSFDLELEVTKTPSAYAPSGTVYIVPENNDFLKMANTLYVVEKDRNEWIRRYENLLNGLRYWQAKAKEK